MSSLYLYPRWLRLWHWYNALLFLVLMVTGVSMHYSGTRGLLPFATAIAIHNVAGILLALGWIGFITGNFISGNWRQYLPRLRTLIPEMIQQARYYAFGIFKGEPYPFHVTATSKFNSLQTLSYLGAMYLIMPLLIASGLGFLLSIYLPVTLLGINSTWLVAMVHVVTSYLLVLFMLVHLYIMTIGESVSANMRAMLTGWHRTRDE